MAITKVADLSFTQAAGGSTSVLKSSALFGSIVVGDRVYNSTRNTYSRVTVKTDSSTLTISPAITGQATGDSITVSPVIQISGTYSNGTATGITATTLTDTGKAWTVNDLTDRHVRLTSGTYSGAIGVISSNTATVQTIKRFVWFNTTTKTFDIVTPTGTPTYEVAYNWNDVVTALPSDVFFLNTTTKKTVRFNTGSGINLAGASTLFGHLDTAVELNPHSVITADTNGSALIAGEFNPDVYGVRGGELTFEHQTSMFVDMNFYGKLYLLGGLLKINKLSTITNYPRWNAVVTTGDGIIMVDSVLKWGQMLYQGNDIALRNKGEVFNFALRSEGLLFSGNGVNDGNYSLAGKYGLSGLQGGKISYPKHNGDAVSGAGTRPFWMDTSVLPFCVSHIFGAGIGSYISTLSNAIDIYNANPYGSMVAAAGTNTTTVYASGSELTAAAEGDYLFNVTRNTLACILSKPAANRATTRTITGQTTGDTITLKTRGMFNHYMHDVVRVSTNKFADGTDLGLVAVGIVQQSDGAGRILDSISTDSTMMTLAAGSDTTNLYCSGTEFANVSVGDFIYNHTLQKYRVVLSKPSSTQLTCDAVTGQTVGDQICFSSSLPYKSNLKRFVVMDANGNYTSSFDSTKGICVQYAFLKGGAIRYETTVTYTSALNIIALRYGYISQKASVSLVPNGAEKELPLSLSVNPYVVASESTARAYTGIAISGTNGAMIITLTSAKTPQEIYDYTEVWRYDEAVNNDTYYEPIWTPIQTGKFNTGSTRLIVGSGGTLTVDTDTDIGALVFGTRPVAATNAIRVQSGGALIVGQVGSQGRSLDFQQDIGSAGAHLNFDYGSIAVETGGSMTWDATEIQTHQALRFQGSIYITSNDCKVVNDGNQVTTSLIPPRMTFETTVPVIEVDGLHTVSLGINIFRDPDVFQNVTMENSWAGFIVGGSAPDNVWVNASGVTFIDNLIDFAFTNPQWMRYINLVDGSELTVKGAFVNDINNNKGLLEIRQAIEFTCNDGAKVYSVDTDNGNRIAANSVGTSPDYLADRSYELTASGGVASYSTDGGVLTAVYWRTVGGLRDDNNEFDSRGLANDTTDVFTWLQVEYGRQPATQNVVMKGGATVEVTVQSLVDLGITQATKATVAAYTGFASETATGATITTAHTTSEVYDRRKYQESENPDWVWDNSKTSYCSSGAGLQYDFASSYSLTLQATLSGKKITGATLVLGTGWGITCQVDTVVFSFPAAGTYDLSAVEITGTVELVNTSGGAVTAQLPLGTSYTNTGPSITVVQSRPLEVTAANIPAGASVRIYNVTQDAELVMVIGTAGAGYSDTLSVSAGGAIEVGDELRLDAFKADGATYSTYYTTGTVVGSTGDWNITTAWTLWAEANALGVDGSAVADFSTDFTDIEIDIVDAPLQTWYGAELVAFILYKTASEAEGMRKYFGSLVAQNAARWVVDVDSVDLHIDNLSADSADQTDEVVISRSDGANIRKLPTTGGGGIGIVISNDVSSLLPVASIAAIKAKTDNLPSDPADQSAVEAAISAIPAAPDAATVATAVRVELAAELARVDVATSTRLASAGYTAPDNAGIAAIKVKTDSLPATPADETTVAAAVSAAKLAAALSA